MRRHWILAAAALAAGCSMGADMKLGENAVAAFHRQLDAGQFDRIYDGSSSEMKASTPRPKLVEFLSAVHAKLGAFKSGGLGGFNDNVSTGGHRLVLVYNAQYQNGAAAETFTFSIAGDRALLMGYNVNSDALILK